MAMPRRQLSPAPATALIDVGAVGERVARYRWQQRWSQETLAQRAGLDPMVISRLERGRKPRLELETAARLARACGWTLDQLCGLAPIARLPAAPWQRWYCPLGEAVPPWLQAGLRSSDDARALAGLVVAWQDRGARLPHIAATFNGWGLPPWGSRQGAWTPVTVAALVYAYTMGTQKGRKALQALATAR